MIIGKLKGATSYKALNMLDKLSNNDKRVLEKVFNVIREGAFADSEKIIEAILKSFSAN